MEGLKIGRNDPCPCGSGKKFKRCHLGRESELMEAMFSTDPLEVARKIEALPPCRHPRAQGWADELELVSAAGRRYTLKLVDLAAYLALGLDGRQPSAQQIGGLFISPEKTKPLDRYTIYMALHPQADDSTVVHQLAHALDYVEGSRLHPGVGRELAGDMGVPAELMEHPQEFGQRLVKLAERFQVELDADDEIIAFLAARHLLMPARLVAKGKREEVVAQAQKILAFLRQAQDEIDARIRHRRGYTGRTARRS